MFRIREITIEDISYLFDSFVVRLLGFEGLQGPLRILDVVLQADFKFLFQYFPVKE